MTAGTLSESESESGTERVAPERAPLGLYIHIPFCEKKCPYCDFNTFARLETIHDAYVEALCLDIRRWGLRLDRPEIDTLFLGGGTPTLLSESSLEAIMESIRESFALLPTCEITSEANPGSVDVQRFQTLRSLGINRLSLGIQSLQPGELDFLGRVHDREQALRAVEYAREVGFPAVNLDFIFGLPDQSLSQWETTLKEALDLRPEHFSLYSLIVEPRTPLHLWVESGKVDPPDEDEAARHYERAIELLADAGYIHYEVSNWARSSEAKSPPSTPHFASRHNLIYWRNQEYLGLGPGAHSHLRTPIPGFPLDETNISFSRRWGGRRTVPDYIARINQDEPVEEFCEWIDPATAMGETMMLGLRLVLEGVERNRFTEMHGEDPVPYFGETIERFEEWNLLEISSSRLRLTPRGLMLANSVSSAFLP